MCECVEVCEFESELVCDCVGWKRECVSGSLWEYECVKVGVDACVGWRHMQSERSFQISKDLSLKSFQISNDLSLEARNSNTRPSLLELFSSELARTRLGCLRHLSLRHCSIDRRR